MWFSILRGIFSLNIYRIIPIIFVLSACGGGGGNSENSPGYTIKTAVSGLTGNSLVLALTVYTVTGQETQTLTVPANGTISFNSRVSKEDYFDVEIISYPQNPIQRCYFEDNSGEIVDADINLYITCVAGYSVSGVISGLASTGLQINLNSDTTNDAVIVNGNGAFIFPTPLLIGETYQINIYTQPDNPLQICLINNGTGTISGVNINNITVNCQLAHQVGGPITGLQGYGLVLQNNSTDNLSLTPFYALADYRFNTPVAENEPYNITVRTQPVHPSQTCTASNSGGVMSTSDITDVAINCVTDTFTVGGSVSGLNGSGLTIYSYATGNLNIDSNGAFTLGAMEDLTYFSVDINSQPTNPNQICRFHNSNNTNFISSQVNGADVNDLQINCINTYTIGGTISGLEGSGNILLFNNGTDSEVVYGDGDFTFNRALIDGSDYSVTLNNSPSDKLCTINNAIGTLSGSNVTNVNVVCTTHTYTIGGTVSGMIGSGLVLQNNAGDDLVINNNGNFTFSTPIEYDGNYEVSLLTPPSAPDQYCTLRRSQGRNITTNIDNVLVECSSETTLQASALSSSVMLSWPQIENTTYDIYYSSDPDFVVDNYASYTDGTLVSNVTSPTEISGLANGQGYYFILRPTSHSTSALPLADSEKIASRPNTIGFDDTVYTGKTDTDGTLYLGGKFNHAGAIVGHGIPLSMTSDNLSNAEFPIVNGEIFVAITDGAGGWFIGGEFTRLSNQSRAGLAHILSDGNIDTSWAPATNGRVNALALVNDIVYIGGSFTEIDGQSRAMLAAVDINGNLLNWTPVVTGDNLSTSVQTIAATNDTIYVGGFFSAVNGVSRTNIAAIDNNGNLTTWSPSANSWVSDIVVDNGDIYIAGNFFKINDITHENIARINENGTVNDFRPDIYGRIYDIIINNNNIYAAGLIVTNNGVRRLVAIGKDGTVDTEFADVDYDIQAITLSGDTLYLAGSVTTVNGESRYNIASIGVDGSLKNWAPRIHGGVINTLSVSGNSLYAGGRIGTFNGVERSGLAAITNGQLESWAPRVNGWIQTLEFDPSGVYFGGSFSTVNDNNRSNLAAVSRTGDLLPWNPAANANVFTLEIADSMVFVGGTFTQINGAYRYSLAAVGTDSNLSNWQPAISGGYYNTGVYDLLLYNNTVYIAGSFSSAGGYTRFNTAAIGIDGTVTSWNPSPNQQVTALARDGDNLILGGSFTHLSGMPRNHLASVNIDGTINTWNPDVATTSSTAGVDIEALFVDSGLIYVGGHFDHIGITQRNNLCAIDSNGEATIWNPSVESTATVYDIDIFGGIIHGTGSFQNPNGYVRNNFASFNSSGEVQ